MLLAVPPTTTHAPCPALPCHSLVPLQDDETAGRRRRMRMGEEDNEEEAGGGALPWPSPFEGVGGSDDEAEDEELLRKAKEGQLLADSAADAGDATVLQMRALVAGARRRRGCLPPAQESPRSCSPWLSMPLTDLQS